MGKSKKYKDSKVRAIVERKLGKKYITLEEKESRKAEVLKLNFK